MKVSSLYTITHYLHRRGHTGIYSFLFPIERADTQILLTEMDRVDHSEDEFTHLNLGYSTKNITIGSRRQVRSILIDKTAKFIRNIRYKPETKRCGLCTAEIYHILYGGYENLLNSKNEINNKCRHKNKYKIGAG